MKKTALLSLFTLFAICTNAQQETDEYELKDNEKPGYIVDKSGKKIDGIVRLAGTEDRPWVNQKRVKFVANTDIDKTRKRQKFKNYDVDDIKEYTSNEGDLSRHFEVIKYTNMKESMNTATSGLSGTLKTFNNITKSNQLAEVVLDGKIKVYKLYGYPTTMAAGQAQIKQMDDEIIRLRNNPSYIYSKNNGKLNELSLDDIKTITNDCNYVKDKIQKGNYSSVKNGTEKKSGLGKFIKKQVDNARADVVAIVGEVIVDYNENCK